MSHDTWHFSFAKYLELRFHGHSYCRRQMSLGDEASAAPTCACTHPLHTEHFHYFGCRDLVASFKYAPISLKEIALAAPLIAIAPQVDLLSRLMEDTRSVAQCGHGLYAVINEWLAALAVECTGTKLEPRISLMIEQQLQERNQFRKRIEEIQLMLTCPHLHQKEHSSDAVAESLALIQDHEVLLKRVIAEAVLAWNSRLQDVIAAKKKEDKSSASKQQPVRTPVVLQTSSSSAATDDRCVPNAFIPFAIQDIDIV